MTLLSDILDIDLLSVHIGQGNVTSRPHQTLPLTILNYTPQCAYAHDWDHVTMKCRGLIYNTDTMEVVARPFEKFWNWDQSEAPFPPVGPALRMPKMDGSLGILYPHTFELRGEALTEYMIATRGSMHSDQALWASSFFNAQQIVNEFPFSPVSGKTYLFEIIYPENRIVVDYGEYEGLVLIDVIDIATGLSDTDEFDNCEWPDKVVRVPIDGFDSGQDQDIPDGDEGFVYLWPVRNFRTKMKAAEYVRIHRLVSGLTAKSIWQHLVKGGNLDQLKADLPEEFHKFIDDEGAKIIDQASKIVNETYLAVDHLENKVLHERLDMSDRKEVALAIKHYFPWLSKYLFLVLDGKPILPVALYSSKPQREVPAITEV